MPHPDPFAAFRKQEPPKVDKKPVRTVQHGEERIDNYAWLRVENWQDVLNDPSALAPNVRRMLDAENAYYAAATDDLQPLRTALFTEMRAKIKEEDASVPMPDGPWAFWREFREGGDYPVFLRAPRNGGARQVILDGDEESKGSEFFSIGSIVHSPNYSLAAYTVDRLGSENYSLKIRNIETGVDLPDEISPVDTDSIAWSADSTVVYYIERDDNQRPKWVKKHVVGTASSEDVLIYEEPDDGYFLSISKSQSGDYIFITSSSQITSEVRFLKASETDSQPILIEPRQTGVEYYPDHRGQHFYIHTNADDAIDFKICKAPVASPGKEHWSDWLPHREGVFLTSITTFKDYIVCLERADALPRIVVSTYDGDAHAIEFDEAAYSLGFDSGYEFDTDVLRFFYESPSTPEETFDYHIPTREKKLLKTQEIPSGHNKEDYVVERLYASAADGAEVPITVLRRKDTAIDGTAPVVLYGYGSYGITIPADFSSHILPVVDRGVIWATAHPRGGAAKGRQWYLDGKLAKKVNTFTDFNAVADALIERNYTSAKNIVIYGGSAGGLLVGAAVNLRPALYAGVLAVVPFVDVLNTISDGDLPLTPPEWEEWGNPIESKDQYDWIRAYSPYENIGATEYPPIMATGGLTDYRVTYWEMAKWTARLREEAHGGPFVLRMYMDAGHGGSAARFQRLEERAHLFAFALKCVGKTQ